MRTFKKAAALGAFAVGGLLAASATAAQAAQVNATGIWTATAGTTSFNTSSGPIACTMSNAAGNLVAAVVPPSGRTPLNLTFTNCTAFGSSSVTTVTCNPAQLEVDTVVDGNTATGHVILPAGACTITIPVSFLGTCALRVPNPSAYSSADNSLTVQTTPAPARVIVPALLNVPFTTNNNAACNFVGLGATGTGSWSGGTYTQTAGTPISITYP